MLQLVGLTFWALHECSRLAKHAVQLLHFFLEPPVLQDQALVASADAITQPTVDGFGTDARVKADVGNADIILTDLADDILFGFFADVLGRGKLSESF